MRSRSTSKVAASVELPPALEELIRLLAEAAVREAMQADEAIASKPVPADPPASEPA
jgi:hypothetical protein